MTFHPEITTMMTTEGEPNTTYEETTEPITTTVELTTEVTTESPTTTMRSRSTADTSFSMGTGTASIQKRSTGTRMVFTPTDVSPSNMTGNWTTWTNETYMTTTPVVMTTQPYRYEPMCYEGKDRCDTCLQPVKIRAIRNVSIPGIRILLYFFHPI